MSRTSSVISILAAALIAPLASAADVDWSQVESTTVKTFYPGQASWEFLLSGDHGSGANRVRSMQKACAECHVGDTGEFDIYADKIISGELEKSESGDVFEPDPLEGMPGFVDVNVQVAHDADNLYVRLQWPGSGASVDDPSLADNDKADRISLQVATEIKTFNMYGCYITCHDDQTDMPENRGEDKKLYAYYTHSGDKIAPQPRLDSHISKDQFMDLWIAHFKGNEVIAEDEYVLESRHDDEKNLSATGSYENGNYTVVMTRPLSTGDAGDLDLSDDAKITIGIAVHDNGSTGRQHYTSFPVTVGLSEAGEITSKQL